MLDEGLVSVAVQDRSESGVHGVHSRICEVVDQVEFVAAEGEKLCRRKPGTGTRDVYVAADSGEGSQTRQRIKDRWIADVAQVNDVIAAAECLDRLGPEQTVRIG